MISATSTTNANCPELLTMKTLVHQLMQTLSLLCATQPSGSSLSLNYIYSAWSSLVSRVSVNIRRLGLSIVYRIINSYKTFTFCSNLKTLRTISAFNNFGYFSFFKGKISYNSTSHFISISIFKKIISKLLI